MATGFDVSSVIQNTNADGTCACDFEKVHLSCARNKVEVFSELPDSGESGTTYLVGNNETGYTEYVWDTRIGFVNMGTANSARNVATADTLGFVRLSTGVTLNDSNAGLIGLNSSLQLMALNATNTRYGTVKLSTGSVIVTVADNHEYRGGEIGADANGRIYGVTATLGRYGMVRLGSEYEVRNPSPFHIGVGVCDGYTVGSNDFDPSRVGQLCINLKMLQSDGSAGCLRCVKGENNSGVLEVLEASDAQMGIVKLCHALPTTITDSSFTGTLEEFQDAYMGARRNTHAASVGLLKDHLDTFLEGYFTDSRIGEFFSRWAGSRALGDEIWANEDYRNVLLDTVVGNAAISDSLQGWAEGSAERYAKDWLTNAKAHELFDALVVNAAKDEARVYWTDEINGVITREVEREVSEQTGVYITQWMKNASNVENLAGVVVQSVLDDLEDKAAETAGSYMDKVFDGEEEISINGEKRNFAAWAEAKIQALVNNTTGGIESKVNTLTERVSGSYDRVLVLTGKGWSPLNDSTVLDGSGVASGRAYSKTVTLPPGDYTVKMSLTPLGAREYRRIASCAATMRGSSGDEVTSCAYLWHGDTGKNNNERSAAYTVGVGRITVDSTGKYEFSVETGKYNEAHQNYATPAYVMVEFV